MTMIFLIYWAAFVLLMIVIANFIAPGMLGYDKNLAKVERFFGQIFKVHCAYTVMTMLAMLLFCVFYNAELAASEGIGRGVNIFMAVFWGSRVIVQIVYYDAGVKQKYPIFNLMFFTAFLYLGLLFSYLAIA